MTLMLLLLDGRRLTTSAVAVFALVVLTVCAVGNYGYALNDLFDVAEDERAGRANAAVAIGTRRTWTIIVLSAMLAEVVAVAAAGFRGAVLTLAELGLPAVYSIPPPRIKERAWLGVAADGLAAHVYPAVIALLAVASWSLRPVGVVTAVSVVVWSAAAGTRGIVAHLLHTSQRDTLAGLRTLVHDHGAQRVERLVVFVVLPLEAAGFAGMLIACNTGPALWVGVALYLLYEGYKTFSGRFRVAMFRPEGQPYIPFVEESLYKSWGPLVIALDAARTDPLYLLVLPAYAVLFQPHLRTEWARIRAVTSALRTSRATGPDARSNEEA